MSICTSLALRGMLSGVGGGVLVCLGRGEDSKGEYGRFGAGTGHGLLKGFSISAEAIRVGMHVTLDGEDGGDGLVDAGTLPLFVWESTRVKG